MQGSNLQTELAESADLPPRSVTRVFKLLECLSAAREGMTLTELGRALSSPPSSLLGILKPLVAAGFFERSNMGYVLGPAVYGIAAQVLRSSRFPASVRLTMDSLVSSTDETVNLATLIKGSRTVVYLDVKESPQLIRYAAPVGTSRPAYASSAGRVMLAFENPDWVEDYLATEPLHRFTPATIVDRKKLRRAISVARQRGYEVGIDEVVTGAAGISAPVFGGHGQLLGALTVAGPTDRIVAAVDPIRTALLEATRQLSRQL